MVGEVVFVMFNGFDCSKRLSSARWIVVCLRFVHLLFAKTVPSLRHRHFGTLWARAAALGGTPYRADPQRRARGLQGRPAEHRLSTCAYPNNCA